MYCYKMHVQFEQKFAEKTSGLVPPLSVVLLLNALQGWCEGVKGSQNIVLGGQQFFVLFLSNQNEIGAFSM
jgi:hypothetical protein